MSVFEELRPFVGLCQACGMIPYSTEHDPITNKFAGFALSFHRLVTWWFCLIFISQLVCMGVMIQFAASMTHEISTDGDIPMTLTILSSVISSLSYLVQFFFSRWVVFRHRKLRNVVEMVQEVERIFQEEFIAQRKGSIRLRFVIGFSLIISITTVTLFVSMPSFQQSILLVNMDIFLLAAVFSITALLVVMFDCTLFFFHMCYYMIAHYMQLIAVHPSEVKRIQRVSQKGNENIEELRRNVLIFHHLRQASAELNDIFSVPILFLLAFKFVMIVGTAFAYIYSFITSNDVLENGRYFIGFTCLAECVRTLVILTAADLPINQVRLLRERLIAISHSVLCETLAEKIAMMTFLIQVDEDLVHLSAAGLFKVGMHLVPALAGATVTYMVILLQN